jgi:DNA (cytosine-5)-methyltransferase 1
MEREVRDKLKVLDLFSGIGGFSLGLERTGYYETVAFCEIEEFPQKVLKKHWPKVPIYSDIRELNYERLKADGIDTIDVITGGYPCQPFSVAGKQKGEQDPRHLWPEYFRLIKECRPTWVIGENVSGHIKLGLDTVLDNLESEGYSARTFSISASSIGAWHKRERIWIIANSECDGQFTSKESRGIGETISKESEGSNDSFNVEGASGLSTSEQDVSNSTSSKRDEHEIDGGHGEFETQEISRDRSSLLGESPWWLSEPNVGRVVDGVPDRTHRIKSLGNSLVPQIPQIIGLAIARSVDLEIKTR